MPPWLHRSNNQSTTKSQIYKENSATLRPCGPTKNPATLQSQGQGAWRILPCAWVFLVAAAGAFIFLQLVQPGADRCRGASDAPC